MYIVFQPRDQILALPKYVMQRQSRTSFRTDAMTKWLKTGSPFYIYGGEYNK